MNTYKHWGHIVVTVGVCALPITVSPAYAAPPTVVDVLPHPGEWVVGPDPLEEVTLIFDQAVTVPPEAVTARTLTGGDVSVSIVSHDPPMAITATFPPVAQDVLTLVIDHTLINDAGEALDGEVDNPEDPDLSSGTGDGEQGGPAVFQFRVLQGDADRNRIVDLLDFVKVQNALDTCVDEPGYDALADLDKSGCVDQVDLDTVQPGKSLPDTDFVAPEVSSVFPAPPGPLPFVDHILALSFDEPIDPSTVPRTSVYGVGEDGALLSASSTPTMAGDRTFFFTFDVPDCLQDYTIKVSNAIADVSGELALPASFQYEGEDIDPPALDCPEALFVNSTEPLGIPAGEVAASTDIQAFLASFQAQDACTGVTVTSSLDIPVDLLLGVNTVTFMAQDDFGNAAECDVALVVVPAVPLACWDLNENGAGDPEEDTNGDGLVDALDCRGPQGVIGPQGSTGPSGGDGADGATGISCWDLNENGEPDDDEDINGDGLVDVADCLGPTGADGEPGAIGPDGPEGPAGPLGPPGQDAPEPPAPQPEPDDDGTSPRGPCGAFGMIGLPFTFLGLCATRTTRRWRR